MAVDAGKKLIDKAMRQRKKIEDIMSKYTANQTKGSGDEEEAVMQVGKIAHKYISDYAANYAS